jgi:trk system potassium uptake protein TrkH
MEKSAASLSYAVRPAVLRYYLSRLALVLGGLTLVPLAAALAFGELRLAGRLAASVAILLLLWLTGRRTVAPRRIQVNEALASVALTFVLVPLLMLPPFLGEGLSLEDALFESVSAVTTTGLSTVSSVHELRPGLLFLRAWMQWYGGLGIAVFSLALVLGHHSGARRLAGLEKPEDLPASAGGYARQVLLVYLGLTAAAVLALWLALGDGLQALLHALAAVSTGGFSGYEHSLADMPSVAARYLTIGAAVLGALPLVLYYQVVARRRWEPGGDPEWWLLPLAVLLLALLLALVMRAESGMAWSAALYHGGLLGASAQSTAGFSSMPVAALGDTAKLLLILAMLGGGSVGSTAGGIKLLRLLILGKLVAFMLRRTTMPSHAVAAMRLGGRNLEGEEVQRALVVIVLFLLTVLLSWLVMVAAGQPVLDALFEVASATGTVGLSAGIVGPDLATGLKLLLCLDMLLGRLEILALLVLLYPPTWLGRRIENR